MDIILGVPRPRVPGRRAGLFVPAATATRKYENRHGLAGVSYGFHTCGATGARMETWLTALPSVACCGGCAVGLVKSHDRRNNQRMRRSALTRLRRISGAK